MMEHSLNNRSLIFVSSSQNLSEEDISLLKNIGKSPLGWDGEFTPKFFYPEPKYDEYPSGIAMYREGDFKSREYQESLKTKPVVLILKNQDEKKEDLIEILKDAKKNELKVILQEGTNIFEFGNDKGLDVAFFSTQQELLSTFFSYYQSNHKKSDINNTAPQDTLPSSEKNLKDSAITDISTKLSFPEQMNSSTVVFDDKQLRQIEALINAGKNRSALTILKTLLQDPRVAGSKNAFGLYYALAITYTRIGNLREAEESAKKVLLLEPSHQKVKLLLEEISRKLSERTYLPFNATFLQIHTYYEEYLHKLFQERSDLLNLSFDDQMETLIGDGFTGTHIIAPYLRDMGFPSKLIVANCIYSQKKWLEENTEKLKYIQSNNIIQEITRAQIEMYKPDILYFGDPITFDSKFITTLSYKPKFIFGWRAAPIPYGTDWSTYDLILSNIKGIREIALKLGAKRAEHFMVGFPSHMLETIGEVKAEYDVCFSGQWSWGHEKRNLLLSKLCQTSTKQHKFTFAPYVMHGPNPPIDPELAKINKGSRFGRGYYESLRTGRICFDCRGSAIGLIDPITKECIDLAKDEGGNARLFEATGMGAFLLTEHFDNITGFFEPGKEIETYKTEEELFDKISYYLDNPQKARDIAHRGQQKCLTEFSLEKRAVEFHDIIFKTMEELNISLSPRDGNIESTWIKTASEPSLQIYTPDQEIFDLFEQAIEAISNSNPQKTLSLISEIEKRNRETSFSETFKDLHYVKALALIELGHLQEAEAELRKELVLNPSYKEVSDLLVDVQLELKRFQNPVATAHTVPVQTQAPTFSSPSPNCNLNLSSEKKRTISEEERRKIESFMNEDENNDEENLTPERLQFLLNPAISPEEESDRMHALLKAYTTLDLDSLRIIYNSALEASKKAIPGNCLIIGEEGLGISSTVGLVFKKYSKMTRYLYRAKSYSGNQVKNITGQLGIYNLLKHTESDFSNARTRDFLGMLSLVIFKNCGDEHILNTLNQIKERLVKNAKIILYRSNLLENNCYREIEKICKVWGYVVERIRTLVVIEKPIGFQINTSIESDIVKDFEKEDPAQFSIESQMSKNERFQLYYLVRKVIPIQSRPYRFIEIGSYAGVSLLLSYLGFQHKSSSIEGIAIEPFGSQEFYHIIRQLSPALKHLKMYSQEAVQSVTAMLNSDGNFPCMIFIDGDHTYTGVRLDIDNYLQFVKKDSFVIFHDYLPPLTPANQESIFYHHGGKEPGVRRAVQETIALDSRFEEVVLPLLYPDDPTQTQSYLPIIPEVYSTLKVYKKLYD
jgi:tetratricopeptide (TPR) repeat protein